MAESPVVLLSGHAPHAQLGRGAFQEMRQAEVAAPLTKAAWTSADADAVAADLARALRLAASGRPGPVHLSLPTDALEKTAREALPDAAQLAPEFTVLAERDAQSAMERLHRARRPMILAGPAAATAPGRARLSALEAASGIPAIAMESPRGIADPSLGAFAEMLAQADCILLLGKRLDFTLKFGASPAISADCTLLQVDDEPEEIERTRRAVGARLAAAFVASAFASIDALTQAARSTPSLGEGWRGEVRSALAFRPGSWDALAARPSGRIHPAHVCRALQEILDSDPRSVFVSDGGEFGQWAQACLAAPHRVINGVAGAIGAGIPFALAAALAHPGAPVVAAMGDGTFGFHPAEIDTAVRYRAPFIALVGNDARWNAEYQIQLRDYGRDRLVGCELLPTRYDQVCIGFGGHGELVTDASQVLPAARRARSSGLPACLNVMIEGLPAPDIRRVPAGK